MPDQRSYTGNADMFQASAIHRTQVVTAITVTAGFVAVTKDSANVSADEWHIATPGALCTITLAPPTAGLPSAGGDDGKELTFIFETTFAHVINCTVGFDGKNAAGTLTAAAKGNAAILRARNGQWWCVSNKGCTIA